MLYIWIGAGLFTGLASAAIVRCLLFVSARPRLSIDNRIFYAPLNMRYDYCIKVTNKSSRHCLYDVEFSSDLVCVSDQEGSAQLPALQVWSLSDACLRPAESRLYYLSLHADEVLDDAETAMALSDFRKVFHITEHVELQVMLKCRHGSSGYSRLYLKRFVKKDFYNQFKLEATT